MNHTIKICLFLLTSILFFSSCQTSNKFGDRGSKYSKGRLAQLEENARKRHRYNPHKDDVQMAKPNSDEPKPNLDADVVYHIDKVEYHAERTQILRKAQTYLGIPYVYAGKSPSQGFDCSGFVGYVYKENKVDLGGGSAQTLSSLGKKKKPEHLHAGDLVFFGEGDKVSHVGIITMNDGKNLTMIHSSSSAGITNDNITHSDYWSARLLYGVDVISAHFEGNIGMK